MGELSASDVMAMNSGNNFLEGNGIIILLLFLLFLGGGNGFGFGGGNNASAQGALTRAEMQDSFNNQNTVNTLNNISMSMNNGFNNLAMGMNNGFNSVSSGLANLGYQMSSCCCDLKTQIGIQGDLTRSLINSNTMQDLRDRLNAKDNELQSAIFASSQLTQTRAIEDFILANKSST